MRARRRPPRRSSVRRRRGARRSSNNWYQSRFIRGAARGGCRRVSPVVRKKEGRRPSGRVCARGRWPEAQCACARVGVNCGSVCVHASRRDVALRACVRAGVGHGERVRARSRHMRALRDRAAIVLGACGMEEPRRVSLRKKTVARGGDVRRGYHEEEDGGRVRACGHRVRLDVRAPDRGAAIVRRSST